MNGVRTDEARWSTVGKHVFIAFALIGGYFLVTEHRAHAVAFLPWLLLLAGPGKK